MTIVYDDVVKAKNTQGDVIRKTSLVYSETFSKMTGSQIYLKNEFEQKTGSFKIRGAYYKIKSLTNDEKQKGKLIVDDGAINALKKGKSLLAAGIINIEGKFNKGDHIKIIDKNMNEFARGLSSFNSNEISKIKGQHSNRINEILGYVTKSEVVHKDDMVEI